MSVIKQFIIIFFYGNLQAVVHWMCVFIILCISPLWQSKSFVFYGAIENHHTVHHMKRQCTLMKIGQSSYFWVWLADWEFYLLSSMFGLTLWFTVEACVAERLTLGTLDLEVRGSSLAHGIIVSLDKELYFTLPLFTWVYKWVPATHC